MADLAEELKAYGGALREGLTGRQTYSLEVPGAASAAGLSVVSFKAVERLDPFVAHLRLTQASRVYRRQTIPETFRPILCRHDFNGPQFSFRLRSKHPQLAFRTQCWMSDWDYSLREARQPLPKPPGLYDEQFTLKDEHSGESLPHIPYRIETADGKVFRGVTDAAGRTMRVFADKAQALKIFKE
ncbi:hypothetical protein [Cupriavidus campinensis]|uniref:hypothetical protein n=1 Tax=Cupriavidus campinensis TaxID=151783 RepID=UPI0011EF8290|nr:hypothetical protein [Cupriavidus campinensis]